MICEVCKRDSMVYMYGRGWFCRECEGAVRLIKTPDVITGEKLSFDECVKAEEAKLVGRKSGLCVLQ
jgi:hypothetical protein